MREAMKPPSASSPAPPAKWVSKLSTEEKTVAPNPRGPSTIKIDMLPASRLAGSCDLLTN